MRKCRFNLELLFNVCLMEVFSIFTFCKIEENRKRSIMLIPEFDIKIHSYS